jgi:hypothetical protein
MNEAGEFREISHCGGQIIFNVRTDINGQRSYQIIFQGNRPVPTTIYSIYALPQGIPIADLPIGGIGSPIPPPPVPGCIQVFIASDSEGKFGFQCQQCGQYWRADWVRNALIAGYAVSVIIFFQGHSASMCNFTAKNSL